MFFNVMELCLDAFHSCALPKNRTEKISINVQTQQNTGNSKLKKRTIKSLNINNFKK